MAAAAGPRGLAVRALGATVACAAVCLRLLWALPPLMQPSTWVSGLAYFAGGCAFTVAALFICLVLLFVSLTKHDELPARKPFPTALEPDKRRGLKRTKSWRKMVAAAKQQQQMWFVGSKPKPPLFVGGRMQGPLWTIPTSAWPRNKLPPEHPPLSDGPMAIAHKWEAHLADGKLKLTLANPSDPSAAPTQVEIELAGCKCSVVQECLLQPDGRKMGPWHKRAPLELSHPTQNLVYGDRSVFLYAETGADKEQWHLALVAEGEPSGPQAAMRSAYQLFCDHMTRAAEILGLPQPPPPGMLAAAAGDATSGSDAKGPKQGAGQQQQQGKGQGRQQQGGQQSAQQPAQQQQQGGKGGRKFGFGWLAKLVPGRRGKPPAQPVLPQPQQADSAAAQPIAAAADAGSGAAGDAAPEAAPDAQPVSGAVNEATQTTASGLLASSALVGAAAPGAATADAPGADDVAAALETQLDPASAPNIRSYDFRCDSTLKSEGSLEVRSLHLDSAIGAATRLNFGDVGSPEGRRPHAEKAEAQGRWRPGVIAEDTQEGATQAGTGGGAEAAADSEAKAQFTRDEQGGSGQGSAAELKAAEVVGTSGAEVAGEQVKAGFAAGAVQAVATAVASVAGAVTSLTGGGGHAVAALSSDQHQQQQQHQQGFAAEPFASTTDPKTTGGDDMPSTPVHSLLRNRMPGAGLIPSTPTPASATNTLEGDAGQHGDAQASPLEPGPGGASPLGTASPADTDAEEGEEGASGRPGGRRLRLPVMPLQLDWPGGLDVGQRPLQLQEQEQEALSGALLPSPGRGMVASCSVPDLRAALATQQWSSMQDFGDPGAPTASAPGPSPADTSFSGMGQVSDMAAAHTASSGGVSGEGQAISSAEAKQRAKQLAMQEQRLRQAAKRQEEEVRRQKQQEQALAKRAGKEAAERQRQAAREQARVERQQQQLLQEARRSGQSSGGGMRRAMSATQISPQAPSFSTSSAGGPHGGRGSSSGTAAAAGAQPQQQQVQLQLPAGLSVPGAAPAVPAASSGAAADDASVGSGKAAGGALAGGGAADAKAAAAAPQGAVGAEAATAAAAAGFAAQLAREAEQQQRGPLVAGLLGLNMLLARVGFEVLGAHRLERWLHRLVQSKLDEFKRPPYLHRLKLETLDLGSAFPMLRDLRGVADTAAAGCIYPQLVLDLAFSGRVTLVVSTTVELQQAGLVKKLQRVFGRMAGLADPAGSAADASGAQQGAPPGRIASSPAAVSCDVEPAGQQKAPPVEQGEPRGASPARRSQAGSDAGFGSAAGADTGVGVGAVGNQKGLPSEVLSAASSSGNLLQQEHGSTGDRGAAAGPSLERLSHAGSAAVSVSPFADAGAGQSMSGSAAGGGGASAGSVGGGGAGGTAGVAGGGGGGGSLLSGLLGLSRAAAAKAGSLAANLTENLPRVPCQLEICVTRFECELMVWAPPPPSDRVWLCFASAPNVEISTRPLFGNRILRYSAVLSQVSALLKAKILKALNKNMVYPSAVDIKLGFWANPGVTNEPNPRPSAADAPAAPGPPDAQAGLSADPSSSTAQGSAAAPSQADRPRPGDGGAGVGFPAQAQAPLAGSGAPVVPPIHPDLSASFNRNVVPLVCTDPALAAELLPGAKPAVPLPPGLAAQPSLPPRPPGTAVSMPISGVLTPASSVAPTPRYTPPLPASSAPPAVPPLAPTNNARKGLSLAFRFRPFGRPRNQAPADSAKPGASAANSQAASVRGSLANSRVNSTRSSMDMSAMDVPEQ